MELSGREYVDVYAQKIKAQQSKLAAAGLPAAAGSVPSPVRTAG
jgi:hypothetical protein